MAVRVPPGRAHRPTRDRASTVLNRAYFQAAGRPKVRWEIAPGGHTSALDAAPSEYRRRVIVFFDHTLQRGR